MFERKKGLKSPLLTILTVFTDISPRKIFSELSEHILIAAS